VDNKFGLFVKPNDADHNNSNKVHDIPNTYIYQMHAALFDIRISLALTSLYKIHISVAMKVIRLQ
jgi:hypothetical protein